MYVLSWVDPVCCVLCVGYCVSCLAANVPMLTSLYFPLGVSFIQIQSAK